MNIIYSRFLSFAPILICSLTSGLFFPLQSIQAKDSSEAPFAVRIEIKQNILTGQEVSVRIFLDRSELPLKGFDFLISYSIRKLGSAKFLEGDLFLNNNNELKFNFINPLDSFPGNLFTGFIRLQGILKEDSKAGKTIGTLKFKVHNNRRFECRFIPIRFFWYDCNDNTIKIDDSNSSLTASRAFYWVTTLHQRKWFYKKMPSKIKEHNGSLDNGCLSSQAEYLGTLQSIDFFNGGIKTICGGIVDAHGDINLNEIQFEREDAELFVNYFIYGDSVFEIHRNGQVATTDVNADGKMTTISDLVFLNNLVADSSIDIIVEPSTIDFGIDCGFSQFNYPVSDSLALFTQNNVTQTISVSTIDTMGAALLVFKGEIKPELQLDGMDMRYNFDGNQTRVLIYSLTGNSFTGSLLFSYKGNGKLISAETAGHTGMLQIESKIVVR